MKSTKDKILDVAHELFTKHGIAKVSLRKIAAAIGISHSNLIYHFKTKNEVIIQLHERILAAAIEENQKLQLTENSILNLMESTYTGFKILYDYRFFMMDLNFIMRENEILHKRFVEIESLRYQMYETVIDKMIENGLMRKAEFEKEYNLLIQTIRIFSDFWLASSEIYDTETPNIIIKNHVRLLLNLFYPYLTESGKLQFSKAHIFFVEL